MYGIKACKVFIPLFGENSLSIFSFLPYSRECTQIQRRAPVEEFALSGEEITSECGGHVLTFKFVHVDGVWKHLDCVCNIKYTNRKSTSISALICVVSHFV